MTVRKYYNVIIRANIEIAWTWAEVIVRMHTEAWTSNAVVIAPEINKNLQREAVSTTKVNFKLRRYWVHLSLDGKVW